MLVDLQTLLWSQSQQLHQLQIQRRILKTSNRSRPHWKPFACFQWGIQSARIPCCLNTSWPAGLNRSCSSWIWICSPDASASRQERGRTGGRAASGRSWCLHRERAEGRWIPLSAPNMCVVFLEPFLWLKLQFDVIWSWPTQAPHYGAYRRQVFQVSFLSYLFLTDSPLLQNTWLQRCSELGRSLPKSNPLRDATADPCSHPSLDTDLLADVTATGDPTCSGDAEAHLFLHSHHWSPDLRIDMLDLIQIAFGLASSLLSSRVPIRRHDHSISNSGASMGSVVTI